MGSYHGLFLTRAVVAGKELSFSSNKLDNELQDCSFHLLPINQTNRSNGKSPKLFGCCAKNNFLDNLFLGVSKVSILPKTFTAFHISCSAEDEVFALGDTYL